MCPPTARHASQLPGAAVPPTGISNNNNSNKNNNNNNDNSSSNNTSSNTNTYNSNSNSNTNNSTSNSNRNRNSNNYTRPLPTPRRLPDLPDGDLCMGLIPVSVKKHSSGEEDTLENQISGWRAVSATGLRGKGLRKRLFLFTDTGM